MPTQLRLEFQQNPVADEVAAVTAVVRPILEGLLNSLRADIVREAGGREDVKLKMLPRLYRQGDGDCGLCFEYAVHDAMNRREATVRDRIVTAMSTHCKVPGEVDASILFGAEKTGIGLIDTVKERLSAESILLGGNAGRPVKLKKHIDTIAAALRSKQAQLELPLSIRGVWKADLFVGYTDTDRWVATTVKINRTLLEAAPGLRIGIVPTKQGETDAIEFDVQRNLIVCPIPHDQAFMQVFYQGWVVVQQFIDADAKIPREARLPRPPDRQVARYLEERREYAIVDVIAALGPMAQPELLATHPRDASIVEIEGAPIINALEAPMARNTSPGGGA